MTLRSDVDAVLLRRYLLALDASLVDQLGDDGTLPPGEFLHCHASAWRVVADALPLRGADESAYPDARVALEATLLDEGMRLTLGDDLHEAATHVASAMFSDYLDWLDADHQLELTPLTRQVGSELSLALPVTVPGLAHLRLPRAENGDDLWQRFEAPGADTPTAPAPTARDDGQQLAVTVGSFFPGDWGTYRAFGRPSVVGTWSVARSPGNGALTLSFSDERDGIFATVRRDQLDGTEQHGHGLVAAIELHTRDGHAFMLTGPRKRVRRMLDVLGVA